MSQSTHCGRIRGRQGLYALLLFGAGAAAAVHADSGATVVLPTLTQPASNEHHIGKVVWADLVTPDLGAAKRFYGGLFGWTFRDVSGGRHYTVAMLDGEPVAGLLQKALPQGRARPAWLTFLSVQDVAAAQQSTLQHGGTVISKQRSYPQRGSQAVLADPEGAVFAVLAAQGGDPPDYLAAPGEWIWSALFVKDPMQETAFYQTLFGYHVYDLAGEDADASEGQHYVLSSDDYARAGLNALPADSKRRHPHWLDFVRVTDAGETARQAVALGGRVLVEPRVDRHGGRLAVLADPSGAPVGIMEWSDTDTKQERQ